MKPLSSSIVVSAGIYAITASLPLLLAGGSSLSLIGTFAGLVTLALGLVGWWTCLKYDR